MNGYIALYCRISKDRSGRVESVKAQERWGREYAAREWPGVPVRVFADNDVSAHDESAHRPSYEQLRAAIGRGEVAHVWAVSQARLSRAYSWFGFAAEMAAGGLETLHTRHDGIVRVQDTAAGFRAVQNVGEVLELKKRLMDSLAEKARLGVPPGASPYGYVHGVNDRGAKTLVILEAEADIIRECAERILNGWSLASIVKDLRSRDCVDCPRGYEGPHKLHGPHRVKVRDHQCSRRDLRKKCACPPRTEDGRPVEEGGIPVTLASKIAAAAVKGWVTNLIVAGHRPYQGYDLGPGTGNWQPILSEDVWQAVRNKLAGPRTVQRSDGGTYEVMPIRRATGRLYLLTGGIAVCGAEGCGAPLYASRKQLSRKLADGTRVSRGVVPYYLCHPKQGGKGCIGIMGGEFEAYVVRRLLEQLDDPQFVATFNTDDHAEQRASLEAEMRALDDQRRFARKLWMRPLGDPDKLTNDEWMGIRTDLLEAEQRVRDGLNAVPAPADDLDLARIREDWDDGMNLDERREVISRYINTVIVKPANNLGRKRGGFDEGRVVIEWRNP